MTSYSSSLRDENARPISGARIFVYDADGTLSTLTDDLAAPLANPLTSDEFGNFSFNASEGRKTLDIFFGVNRVWKEVVLLGDIPLEGLQSLLANTRAALAAYAGMAAGQSAILGEAGREGAFVWSSADLSAQVSADPQQGVYVAPASDATGATGAWVRRFVGSMAPEWFGAAGDGTADDYDALKGLFSVLNYLGGGSVQFGRGKVYKIDRYVVAGNGVTDFSLSGVNGLVLDGNGAKLDLKGNFDRAVSTTRGLAFYYDNCSSIVVRNLEIDGNIDQMTNSSASAEPPSYGFAIRSTSDMLIENVHVHHFSGDGIIIRDAGSNGTNRPVSRRITLSNVRSLYNGRQGISLVAVRGFQAENSTFSYTGRAAGTYGAHSPGAGCDVEPTRTTATAAPDALDINVGDIEFRNCVFEENIGSQFLCGGAVAYDDIRLSGCRLKVGTGSTSGADGAVVGCPGFVMRDCDVDMGQADKIFYIWPNAGNIAADIMIDANRFAGALSMRTNGAPTGRIVVRANIIRDTGTTPYAGNGIVYLSSGSNVRFLRNRVYIPKERYIDGGSGDFHNIVNLQAATLSEENRFETDLLQAAGSSATAHYAVVYGTQTVARNDIFVGTNPGTAETFRPRNNSTGFPSQNPYSQMHVAANVPGVIARSDQASSPLTGEWPWILRYNSALTANRAVTLSTTAPFAFAGARFRIERTAASTGAFTVDVGTGPLASLRPSTWCEVEYDGAAWVLSAFGPLSSAVAPAVTYAAPAGGATVDAEARASLAQLASDVADMRTKLKNAGVTQ